MCVIQPTNQSINQSIDHPKGILPGRNSSSPVQRSHPTSPLSCHLVLPCPCLSYLWRYFHTNTHTRTYAHTEEEKIKAGKNRRIPHDESQKSNRPAVHLHLFSLPSPPLLLHLHLSYPIFQQIINRPFKPPPRHQGKLNPLSESTTRASLLSPLSTSRNL